jgi:hypothetical protein
MVFNLRFFLFWTIKERDFSDARRAAIFLDGFESLAIRPKVIRPVSECACAQLYEKLVSEKKRLIMGNVSERKIKLALKGVQFFETDGA